MKEGRKKKGREEEIGEYIFKAYSFSMTWSYEIVFPFKTNLLELELYQILIGKSLNCFWALLLCFQLSYSWFAFPSILSMVILLLRGNIWTCFQLWFLSKYTKHKNTLRVLDASWLCLGWPPMHRVNASFWHGSVFSLSRPRSSWLRKCSPPGWLPSAIPSN